MLFFPFANTFCVYRLVRCTLVFRRLSRRCRCLWTWHAKGVLLIASRAGFPPPTAMLPNDKPSQNKQGPSLTCKRFGVFILFYVFFFVFFFFLLNSTLHALLHQTRLPPARPRSVSPVVKIQAVDQLVFPDLASTNLNFKSFFFRALSAFLSPKWKFFLLGDVVVVAEHRYEGNPWLRWRTGPLGLLL